MHTKTVERLASCGPIVLYIEARLCIVSTYQVTGEISLTIATSYLIPGLK